MSLEAAWLKKSRGGSCRGRGRGATLVVTGGKRRDVTEKVPVGAARWELGEHELWEEMDWIARECGLTGTEKAVLSMARLDSHTESEIAEVLGLTPRVVAEVLVDALRKARARFEAAATPRYLFWEEVRQKSRCIYQKRRIGWLR